MRSEVKKAKKAKFQVIFAFFASTLTVACESDFENASLQDRKPEKTNDQS
jgi:hypothetical protein